MTTTERLQRIKVSIQRGDYHGLRDGGEALVFTRARELGVTAAELIRGWAAGDARATADNATCERCNSTGMLGPDEICPDCHGTGDADYQPEQYPPDWDFSSPGDGPDSDDDDSDDDEDSDRRRRDDDEDDEPEGKSVARRPTYRS
jgi:hypothetical protein